MYERMLDKSPKPADTQIQEYLGNLSYGRLIKMEEYRFYCYNPNR
ncbi:hypothetical protein OBV_39010 [Oscillibacter valericigenes Sjm18-20]|nr:hypothetical protein OBV_39010 [Oscillibacter valericigenes Sjm18-20]